LSCYKEKKQKKNQARPDAPPAGQANAHEHSLWFVITFFYRTDRTKILLRVIHNS
jgi:hypothetical protein